MISEKWYLIGILPNFFLIVECVQEKIQSSLPSKVFHDIAMMHNNNMMENGACEPHEEQTFRILDYVVLAAMLIVSCAIGTFYGFFARKQRTSADFLLGGSSMGTIPMSLSLAASFITAIELLGNPAEMFQHGTQFWTICIAFICIVPITSKLYLPVYMKLRLTSTFEYLEMRFDKKVRFIAALIYVIQMTLYTSVTVYAPALALSHVTKLNVYYAVTLVYVVCIFYSSQGGMKAVIMTDTFQAAVLMGSLLLIAFIGDRLSGGPSFIFDLASNSSRLEFFKTNISFTERHTIWTQVVGGILYWVPMFCSNQASIQKYLSVETIGQVRIALWISAISLIIIYSINFYTGMILFAEYYQCDPLKNPERKADEILPYYVMNVLGKYYGIPGFFVAGIFAASLGTVASALNSLAAVFMKDFLDSTFKIRVEDHRGAKISKWISIVFGALSFLFVFVVERIDSVLKAALTFNGMVGGITLGLFSLGMFTPWANSKGALFGALVAMALMSWIGIGSQIVESEGFITEQPKPSFNESCSCFVPAPVPINPPELPFILFRISYMWYSAIGFLTTITVGLLVSYMTGLNDPRTVDFDLISPAFQKFYNNFSADAKVKFNLPLEIQNDEQSSKMIVTSENGSIVPMKDQAVKN